MDDSPGPRTRRQAALASTPQPDKHSHMNGHAMNGSAHPRSQSSHPRKKENIFLFYPNIIGYSRIVLAIASLYYMPVHPRTCSLLYCLSCLLDALDGVAARYFNQSTQFGAVLDMVTDRCTTSCLLVFLSSAFPRWALIFQMLISLDFASHYVHMFATLTMAGGGVSHKKVDSKRSWLLHLYYTNKVRRIHQITSYTLFTRRHILPLSALLRSLTGSYFSLSSSPSAPSTNYSSYPSTSFPSPRQPSRRTSSPQQRPIL